jgi:Zn-dependent peptidase ImmA (M78 family)
MSRSAYYNDLKQLALEKRALYAVETSAFGLREIRKIYNAEGIRIDQWTLPAKIKAIYMCANGDYSVAVQRTLPEEPKLFALVHELKHHYRDQLELSGGMIHCGDYNANELIEKGAEVFAAEFIYPEVEFAEHIDQLGVNRWEAETVVLLKRQRRAKVSYKFLCKRLERLGLVVKGQFDRVQFQNLEDSMFGVPFWRARRHRKVS